MHLLIEAYYTLSDTLNKFCKNIHKPNTTHAYWTIRLNVYLLFDVLRIGT